MSVSAFKETAKYGGQDEELKTCPFGRPTLL